MGYSKEAWCSSEAGDMGTGWDNGVGVMLVRRRVQTTQLDIRRGATRLAPPTDHFATLEAEPFGDVAA